MNQESNPKVDPASMVRYSQMTEQEAAERFEQRRKMLLNGLERQQKLVKKKIDNPPRSSSVKTKQSIQQKDQSPPVEFIVLKPATPPKQSQTKYRINDNGYLQDKVQNSLDRIKIQMKQTLSSDNEFSQQTKNSPVVQKGRASPFQEQTSQPTTTKSILRVNRTINTPLANEQELNNSKIIRYDQVSKGKIKNLLGDIGNIDLELQRLLNEERKVQSPVSTKPNPYFDVKDSQSLKHRLHQNYLQPNQSQQLTGSHRSFSQDTKSNSYTSKALSLKKQQTSSPKKLTAHTSQSNKKPNVSDMKIDDKPNHLNITIQFQQSIDNSRNHFHTSVKERKNGERLIATDRKKKELLSTTPNGEQQEQILGHASPIPLKKSPSMKSVKNQSQKSNSQNKSKQVSPSSTPIQMNILNGQFTFCNIGSMSPDETTSNKSQNAVGQLLRPTKLTLHDKNGQKVLAQIDQAVQLYNNLKNLISTKSKHKIDVKPPKPSLLEQYEHNVAQIQDKKSVRPNESRDSKISYQSELAKRDLKSIFRVQDQAESAIYDSQSSGSMRKLEEKQFSLLVQAKNIQDYFSQRQNHDQNLKMQS